MISVSFFKPHVYQTILADEQFRLLPIFLRIRAKVPRINFKFADLHLVYVFHFCDGFVLLFQRRRRRIHFRIRLLHVINLIMSALLIARYFPV